MERLQGARQPTGCDMDKRVTRQCTDEKAQGRREKEKGTGRWRRIC